MPVILITVNGVITPVTYQAVLGDTRASVAQELAMRINDEIALPALEKFTATVEGNMIVIVNRAGDTFTFGNSAQIDTTTANTTKVMLAGAIVAGETWTITIDGLKYVVTADATTTIPQIAVALAATVNTNTLNHAAEALANLINMTSTVYTAVASNGTLTINTTGADFIAEGGSESRSFVLPQTTAAASQLITLTGVPLDGESWTILLDDGTETSFVYSVPRFTATAEGDMLLIVNRSASSFVTSVTVTPAGSSATTPVTVPTKVETFTINLNGTPVTGETWSVNVNGTPVSVVVGSIVNSEVVDTLAEIAETLAVGIRANTTLNIKFAASAKDAA